MRNTALFTLFPLFLSGCGIVTPLVRSKHALDSIELDQTRESVIAQVGGPSERRGSVKLDNGSIVKTDQYNLYPAACSIGNMLGGIFTLTYSWWSPSYICHPTKYWVQYVDGKVSQWGQAGDWQPNQTVRIEK